MNERALIEGVDRNQWGRLWQITFLAAGCWSQPRSSFSPRLAVLRQPAAAAAAVAAVQVAAQAAAVLEVAQAAPVPAADRVGLLAVEVVPEAPVERVAPLVALAPKVAQVERAEKADKLAQGKLEAVEEALQVVAPPADPSNH